MSKPKPNTNKTTEGLLNERNATHGSFVVNSRVSQALKAVVRQEPLYAQLGDVHKEALDHIFGKIGRIMAGQPTFDDHWDDISGYALLPKKFKHGKMNTVPLLKEE
jgi:hypothetical protein